MVIKGEQSWNDDVEIYGQFFEMLPFTISLSFLSNFGGTTLSQKYTKIFTGICTESIRKQTLNSQEYKYTYIFPYSEKCHQK